MMTTSDRLEVPLGKAQKPPVGVKAGRRAGLTKFVVVLVLIGIAGAIVQTTNGFIRRQSEPAVKTPPPVLTVSAQPVSIQQIDREITVNGSISAWDPVSVGAEAGGLE